PTTTPPTAGPAACLVSWTVNQWTGGFTADVRITNRGPAVTGWTLTWSFGADQRVISAWNAQVSQSGAAVTARNVAWNGSLPQGGTASFGLQGSYGTGNPPPTGFRLNGTACQIG
ncbi:cellulose-binding domain-containing protein, partial [Micromonospora sp. KC723]|uniref:cellulose-binding domain-containing protein n=1 Tax=Micromonospora sp. KC723 TaxID=2530381 RepID=UPI0010E1306B